MSLSVTGIIAVAALGLVAAYTALAAIRTDLPWSRWRVVALAGCRLVALGALGAWLWGLRVEWTRATDRVDLVVVADRSASISAAGQKTVDDWVERAKGFSVPGVSNPREVTLAGRTSEIAEALDLARASFTGRGEKRILLLSDGRATSGDPLDAGARLAHEGIKVYAVPAEPLEGESLIAGLAVPAAAWRSVPIPIEVTVRAVAPGPCRLTLFADGVKKGEVILPRAIHNNPREVNPREVTVEMKAAFDKEGVHRIEVRAEFAHDVLDWNNAAAALIDVPLAPRVVILSEVPPARHPLGATLSASGFQVRVLTPGELPPRLACDCIVLDNVSSQALGEARMRAIEGFVREGGAIVFTGGPNAFGAGGYRGTPLEAVLPVLLEPKKEYPPFALAVVLDNSWSMNEGLSSKVGKIDLAKEIAIAAIEGLNKGDWLTLVSFDSDYHNIIQPTKVEDLEPAKYEVSRIGAFGMTNILGGLEEAARILKPLDAAYKHILLISDGKETEVGTDYSHLLSALERMHVTLSTIGVGLSTNARLLNTLAYAGKGRYRHVGNLTEIPAVVLQEAKNIESQLLAEVPLPARQLEDDPALAGIDVAALPPLTGYNRSRSRPHAWTPLVISPKREPLLARMRYGRGQSVAFLSSATSRWARDWMEKRPADYVAFWRQLVVSALGPPSRPLEPAVEYEQGWPVFHFACSSRRSSVGMPGLGRSSVLFLPPPSGTPERPGQGIPTRERGDETFGVSRLAGGKVATEPLAGPVRVGDADAVLVTARGKSNRAFSWSRTYGREFADPASGVETLKELSRMTGGAFQPRPEDVFAQGKATAHRELDPTLWLIAAAGLLIIELLLRRAPAIARLFPRSSRSSCFATHLPEAPASSPLSFRPRRHRQEQAGACRRSIAKQELRAVGATHASPRARQCLAPTGEKAKSKRELAGTSSRSRSFATSVLVVLGLVASQADAMEVSRQGSKLTVTGANFRYTWDTRRGGELAEVEQQGLAAGGWWLRGMPGRRPSAWQRVNSTFAWRSLDTIPALSFSTKRMAYYSGEWTIAYANADREATLKISLPKVSDLREGIPGTRGPKDPAEYPPEGAKPSGGSDEVAFETESHPKILENRRLPVPWVVRQRVRVFDSGIVITTLDIRLPEGEVYELDWATMSVNLDDSLYKEPSPERQARFVYGWAFPGEGAGQFNSYKPVLQEWKRLPLDIDVKPQDAIQAGKPLLYGSAAYDLSHVKGSAQNGFAECCLDEARSLVGTKGDFGSHVMIRPQSGMSPVPTYAGSMRNQPCFGVSWDLFNGETRGLNEPLSYANTFVFAVGSRKRSSKPDAPADDRNRLLGARVYYARDRLPSPQEVKAMAAEGCDTLILGTAWRDAAAAIEAAHAAGLRVGATVDVKDLKSLVAGADWFTKPFQKDRDGLFVTGVSFLNDAIPDGEFEALGEKVAFKHDGPFRANAGAFAICMRALRRMVGEKGFLIGDPGPSDPTLLSFAEFDLHASANLNPYLWGSPQERCFRRYRAGAGFAPILDSMSPQVMALAAIQADTPIVLWPPKDPKHLAWWDLCRRLPAGGSRVETDLIAAERRFTTTSPHVHGTLFDGGSGRLILLLAAEEEDSAKVTLSVPGAAPKEVDAGPFSQWQVKLLEIP